MAMHRHEWQHVLNFGRIPGYTCACGSACSRHGRVLWYSPARMRGNGWQWLRVPRQRGRRARA